MSRRLLRVGLAVLALPVLVVVAGQLGLLASQAPDNLGEQHGQLRAPSATRNSVSSQVDRHPGHPQGAYAAMEPWPWIGETQDQVVSRLLSTLDRDPSIRVVTRSDRYIHAEARTRWLGFVDDVEFVVSAEERAIHFRSGSRLGREDLGTNRRRMEALRERYERP